MECSAHSLSIQGPAPLILCDLAVDDQARLDGSQSMPVGKLPGPLCGGVRSTNSSQARELTDNGGRS